MIMCDRCITDVADNDDESTVYRWNFESIDDVSKIFSALVNG